MVGGTAHYSLLFYRYSTNTASYFPRSRSICIQKIRGKGVFRLIYFLPYITPPVAAAAVFRVFFSGRPTARFNSVIASLGGKLSYGWMNSTGIFQMMLGSDLELPAWAVGPSLALVVLIIYNIWSYVGYDTVILTYGNLPGEL